MSISKLTAHEIVNRFGGHPAALLGIELPDGTDDAADGDAQLGRWLIAVCLTSTRVDEAVWERAFAQLDRAGLTEPGAIAQGAGSAQRGVELESVLREAKLADAERVALKLMRVSVALVEHYGGSLDALARSADSLEELGGRLAALAPGFGSASVARFLRPLRERWAQAGELPIHPSACAAAIHLGLLSDDPELEATPATLRAAISEPGSRSFQFRDLEAALERLGTWCRRNRTQTCPLEANCPAREARD